MKLTRRSVLAAAGSVSLSGLAKAQTETPATDAPRELPDKSSFAPMDVAYLNSGSQHPISLGARAQMESYIGRRAFDAENADYDLDQRGPLEKFARLVNADLDEVTYVQSTTAGEHLVLKSLGLPESGGHVITDTLHFFGSIPMYEEMARQGVNVTWVRDRDGRIPVEDIRHALRDGAKLVSLSLVSTINGFEHDLKTVCDLAHEKGALVYADIIHAAGCTPVDLHASGVDFAACATYKWLMGEFGLGFLYVRKDVRPQIKRVNYGYYGMNKFQSHIYPLDPPGDTIADYEFRDDATGNFAIGTHSHAVIAALNHSLDYIQGIGVSRIQAHAQTMIERLKEELPQRGYQLMTPRETKTPLVTFVYEGARNRLGPLLREANVQITTRRNSFRVTPSVFNDMGDIDRLLAALPKSP